MSALKKLAGETAIYGIPSILGRLLNWLLIPLYTNIFIESEYGVVVNLYAYMALLLILLTYGIETSFFRFAGKTNRPEKVFSTSLISLLATSLMFLVLIVCNTTRIAQLIDYSGNSEYIRWMAIIIALDAVTAIPFAQLRFRKKAVKFASIKMINILVMIGLNLFFLLLCPWLIKNGFTFVENIYSEKIGVGYVFISNLLASGLTLLLLLPEMFRVKWSFDKELLKSMLKYGFPILLVGIAGVINQSMDKILLKELLPEGTDGMAQTGIYGANYKLGIFMALFIQAFRYAFEPFFFSQKSGADTKQIYADIMKYFVVFGLVIFLGVMFYIDIVKLLIGSRYHEGLKVVPLILMANLFLGIFYTLSLWYKLTDKTKFGAYFAYMGAGITLALNFILVPKIGYMGSAIAGLTCYVFMTIASYFVGRKHYPIPYDLKSILFYFGVATILFLVSIQISPEGLIARLGVNTLLMLGFMTIILRKEKALLKGLRRK
ncbi:lipopolysaccharide biosynthesis protein [Prolixibacteraceae bacterium JC049]|nr:lipopolysaccharide biosynthesis protein [Prolixibacteraceae bacterium JC049]